MAPVPQSTQEGPGGPAEGLMTISGYAALHRHDRRTLKRRLEDSGVGPVRAVGRLQYYAETDMALVMKPPSPPAPEFGNQFRNLAQIAALHAFETCTNDLPKALRDLTTLTDEEVALLAGKLWFRLAGILGDYIGRDALSTFFVENGCPGLDDAWEMRGGESEPLPRVVRVPIPKSVQQIMDGRDIYLHEVKL